MSRSTSLSKRLRKLNKKMNEFQLRKQNLRSLKHEKIFRSLSSLILLKKEKNLTANQSKSKKLGSKTLPLKRLFSDKLNQSSCQNVLIRSTYPNKILKNFSSIKKIPRTHHTIRNQ
jgi:hypothetical protein